MIVMLWQQKNLKRFQHTVSGRVVSVEQSISIESQVKSFTMNVPSRLYQNGKP